MKINNKNQSGIRLKQQVGAALLIAMVVLASVAAFYLMGQFGSKPQKQERQQSRIASLASAKKALIAYAVNYIDTDLNHEGRLGFLPCPDIDENGLNPEEGQQDVGCGNINESAIGRFPYRALDTAVLKDDSNECLWYAVSGYYKNSPETEMLNEDTNGMFEVYDASGNKIYGSNAQDRVVAIVFAPRRIVDNQNRDATGVNNNEQCGGNYTVTEYLDNSPVLNDGGVAISNNDLGAADAVDDFVRAGTATDTLATPFNDQIIVITRDEIWDAIKRRNNFQSTMENLTQEIARCVTVYGNAGSVSNLPWPAEIDLATAGVTYRDDASYSDTTLPATPPASLLGRLPEDVQASENQLDANPGTGGGGGAIPPTGGPACTDCWTAYNNALADALIEFNEEKAEAQQEWQDCIDRRRNPRPCDNELTRDLADAQQEYDEDLQDALDDYNNCLAANSCTPGGGGGGGGSCVDCQSIYDTTVADALVIRDQAISDARGVDYAACRAARNSRRFCNRQRRNSIDLAQSNYSAVVDQAQTDLASCITNNSCGGGRKGIDNILSTCPGFVTSGNLDLWKNWKDHFFYVVSGSYAPDSVDVSCTSAGAQCVSTGGNDHAAIVLFSGERQAGVSRNDPVAGDVDSKNNIANYLEGNNAANYLDPNGNKAYDPSAGNDYLYCINDTAPLTVGACP